MPKLLEVETSKGAVLFEVAPAKGEIAAVSKAGEVIEKMSMSMGELLGIAAAVAEGFHEAIKDAPVNGASLEFGLQFTATGKLYVVEAQAQSAMKVTLNVIPGRGME